jgi:hypothetical protein
LQPSVQVGNRVEIEQGFAEFFESFGRKALDLLFNCRIKVAQTLAELAQKYRTLALLPAFLSTLLSAFLSAFLSALL